MRVAKLKEAYPTAKKVELWCEDGHRLALKPIISKAWSPIGERPLGEGPPALAVHLPPLRLRTPENRRGLVARGAPRQRGEVFSLALEHFAGEAGAGKRKRILLLVLDRAGWHTAEEKLKVPEGIHLEFLPSHSPELQPAERLWPLSDESVANRYFERIEQLEEALVERWVALGDQPEVIRSYIRYHWWPDAA
jgi:transposase